MLAEEGLVPAPQRAAIDGLLAELADHDIYDLQERYFALFDRSRTLSLHLFEHVHGESRDRGQAMADLIALYRGHGFEPTAGELPDFLPLFLEFLSLLPGHEAQALLAEPAGILQILADRLVTRKSTYAAAFQALADWPTPPRSTCRIPSPKTPTTWWRWMRPGRKQRCISDPANKSTVAAPIACGRGFAPPPATRQPSEEMQR